jgi:hypothetical protein
MERRNKIIIFSLLVALIGALIIFEIASKSISIPFLDKKTADNSLKSYSKQLFDLERKLDEDGDTKAKASSIKSEVRKILRASLSPEDEAHAKLFLARILIYRFGDNPGTVEGINLVKEIPKDERYPAIWRAKALEFISNLIRDVPGQDYVDMIWNDSHYKPLQDKDYPDSGGVRNICEASLKIYNLPLCNYRLAGFELDRLIEDKVFHTLDDEKRNEYLSDAKNKIAKAEALSSAYPFQYKSLFDEARLSLRRAKRHKELFLLGQASNDSIDKSEEEFMDCKKIYSKGTISMYKSSVYVDYNYVAFLAETHRDDRSAQIKELTNDIVDLYHKNPNSAFFVYMKKIRTPSFDNKYISMQVSLLSKINPEFKKIFLDMGWSGERLNTPYPKLP